MRSFDWLRIGVVAVRDTYSAISKQTVSMPPRIDLGGDGVDGRVLGEAAAAPGQSNEIDVRHRGLHDLRSEGRSGP